MGVTLLSSSTSVERYFQLKKNKNIDEIVKFVKERFEERYIKPFENKKYKNGFIMMASACLLIESLESFYQGWKKSPNTALAFCQFFERNLRFDAIRGLSQEFYVNVRCGIMHQGETTNGWHIRRDLGKLFDKSSKTIDATVFLNKVNQALDDYCNALKNEDWEGKIWRNFRKKMRYVCENTKAKA